jgi:hypothetical protein
VWGGHPRRPHFLGPPRSSRFSPPFAHRQRYHLLHAPRPLSCCIPLLRRRSRHSPTPLDLRRLRRLPQLRRHSHARHRRGGPPRSGAFYWHLGDFRVIYDFDEDYKQLYVKAPLIIDYEENAWDDFIQNQLAPFADTTDYLVIGNHELILPKTRADYLIQSPTGSRPLNSSSSASATMRRTIASTPTTIGSAAASTSSLSTMRPRTSLTAINLPGWSKR